jgi:hypothetical protein
MLIMSVTYEVKRYIMSYSIYKKAGLEDTGQMDSKTGLPIRVSTTVRKKYRKYWSGQELGAGSYSRMNWASLENDSLNKIIAQDFDNSADGVVHHFKSNKPSASDNPEWIEIRIVRSYGGGMKMPFNIFLSVIRDSSVDIITVTTAYRKPGKPRLL